MAEKKIADTKVEVSEWPLVQRLTKPIKVAGDEVTELSFREPTVMDIEQNDSPVLVNYTTGAWDYKFPQMTQMMSALATVPPSAIRSLDRVDYMTIALKLAPHFFPDLSR